MIPRIIHQTWKDHDIPERFREAQESWKRYHPDWEYRFWTDEDIDSLVHERAPDLAPLYDAYPNQIQRVDAARYVILREFGGLYADLDLECLKPFDELLGAEMVLPRTTPFGLSGQLMLSRPGHPFFGFAVRALHAAFKKWYRWFLPRHLKILASTGPLFVTECVQAYKADNGGVEGLRVMSLDEHGHGDPDEAFIHNHRGKTWAGVDTLFFNLVHDNWKVLAAVGLMLAIAVALASML